MTDSLFEGRQLPHEKSLFGSVPLLLKDKIPTEIDLGLVIKVIEARVPSHFFDRIDYIYIGEFDILEERALDAVYQDGIIFLTNEQISVEDIVSDVIHEVAHAVEENYPEEIYGDGSIQREFLQKRSQLEKILTNYGYNTVRYDFLNTEYDEDFDMFLYEDVTYDVLEDLTDKLFVSPYGATSLREYFANAFESFYSLDHGVYSRVEKISPEVFAKINLI